MEINQNTMTISREWKYDNTHNSKNDLKITTDMGL